MGGAPFLELAVERGQAGLERVYRGEIVGFCSFAAPCELAVEFLVRARCVAEQRAVFLAHGGDPARRGLDHAFVEARQFIERILDLLAHGGPALPQRGERLDFFLFELDPGRADIVAELVVAFGQRFAGLVRGGGELFHRLADAFAQAFDLRFAGFAEFVDPLEPLDHLVELRARGSPGLRDIVGDVLGRARNDGQVAAQALHVFQGIRADIRESFDLAPIVRDQFLEAARMLADPINREPSERFELARLLGEEFARDAELAVDVVEPRLELFALDPEDLRCLGEAFRLAAARPQGQQPGERDHDDRRRPASDQFDRFERGHTGDRTAVSPAEECRPAENGEGRERGRNPSTAQGWNSLLLVLGVIFAFEDRIVLFVLGPVFAFAIGSYGFGVLLFGGVVFDRDETGAFHDFHNVSPSSCG